MSASCLFFTAMTSAPDLISLLTQDTTIKVSSTLDKSVGKKNLIDGSPETCWTSQQGLPQFVQLTFPEPVIPKRISLTFQGGFVGTQCSLHWVATDGEGASSKEWQLFANIYPEDVNRRQTFDLQPVQPELADKGFNALKLVFLESSDFFGRITMYDLKLEGIIVE